MFEKLQMAPRDAILGLTEQFNQDRNPEKINLSVGVYKDGEGRTPVFQTVKEAERRLLQQEASKDYLSIEGLRDFAAAVQDLVFGPDHEVLRSGLAVTAQTPGGTGALRVAGEFIARMQPGTRVWLSDPTWPNHVGVFRAAGLEVRSYPYFDPSGNCLAFGRMLEAMKAIPAGDALLLHGCCHNPTGIDPTPGQWAQIADVVQRGKLLAVVDLAYQGLGQGLTEDAVGVLTLCREGTEMLVASSFSKNFGLYNERVGALTTVAASPQAAQVALSHIKACIRANYSNPPAHGAAIVATILGDAVLRARWEQEVRAMRERIHQMRRLFVRTLKAKAPQRDFSFIADQQGMFSFSGLTAGQVKALRDKYAIYVVESGRINVAGMTEANMDALCRAIADVL